MLHRYPVHGPVVATRERGSEVRQKLEALLRTASPGDVVEVDLTGVEAMTVSFADELVGRLMADRASGEFQDQALVVVGKSDDVRETLEVVLERRGLGVLYRDARHGSAEALAGPPWFRRTVTEAQRLGTFRAMDLARTLDLSPQAANNRLKQLSASGAVLKERVVPAGGGKEFEYRAATTLSPA